MTHLNERETEMYMHLITGRREHMLSLASLVHTVMEDKNMDASRALKHVLKLIIQIDDLADNILKEMKSDDR